MLELPLVLDRSNICVFVPVKIMGEKFVRKLSHRLQLVLYMLLDRYRNRLQKTGVLINARTGEVERYVLHKCTTRKCTTRTF